MSRVPTPFHQYFARRMGVDGRDKPGQDDEINQFEIWIRCPDERQGVIVRCRRLGHYGNPDGDGGAGAWLALRL
jgi:hypothetical protein